MLKKIILFVAALALFAAPRAQAAEIIVSAAASLSNAFTEVKEAFEKGNPDIKVVTNFASSNALLAQIESGAPADVFASADQATMDKAAAKGLLLTGSRSNFASNGLVLIAPAQGGPKLAALRDLTAAQYSGIAIGNPDSVPAGRYAREALQEKGIWETLLPKFIYGENVRQVLDYVARGEVQAGFVYSTDAKQAGNKVRVVEEIALKTPALYPIAVLSASKNQAAAKRFTDFAQSPAGRGILAKYGFGAP